MNKHGKKISGERADQEQEVTHFIKMYEMYEENIQNTSDLLF